MENKLILINQILVDLKELKDDIDAGSIMTEGITGVINVIFGKVEEVKKGVEEEIADAEAKQKEAEEAEKAN
jgi:hypothetical protein